MGEWSYPKESRILILPPNSLSISISICTFDRHGKEICV